MIIELEHTETILILRALELALKSGSTLGIGEKFIDENFTQQEISSLKQKIQDEKGCDVAKEIYKELYC